MNEELKNCPFCNSDCVVFDSDWHSEMSHFTCKDCGFHFTGHIPEEELRELWNQMYRSTIPESAELKDMREKLHEAIALIDAIQGQIKGHYPKLDSIIEEFLEDDR